MTYYAITGRVHGDDEDVARVLQADSLEQAEQAFVELLREDYGISESDAATGEEWTNVYVNTVFSSNTEIELVACP